MRVNAENCVKTADNKTKAWLAEELVKNLRELKDRTDTGDADALPEFFKLFCFESKARAA